MNITNKMLVKSAQIHQPVDLAGIITKKTLSDTNMPGLKMWWCPQGLILELKGVTAVIPHANVAVALFDEKQEEEKKTK